MSITIKATGSDGGSVNLTVQSGIGPVGPNAVLLGGTGIDVTYANGEATLDVNATLATLTDVSAAAPSVGQVLEWNGTAWAPAADSTLNLASATPSNLGTAAVGTSAAAAREDHVHAMPSLGGLTDVTLSSPSAGEVLTYNGTAWTAAADSTNLTGYATESYVDSSVANLVNAAPGALDTLNELAAALGDDPNFSTTITNSLAGKAAANHTHNASDISGLANVATSGNYSELFGIPSEFTPEAHTHVKANITDLTTSDLDMGGHKVLFANVYSTLGDLPDASTYHGMFAHVHAAGAAYYAHAGQWVELADADHGHTSAEIADFATAAAANAPLQSLNGLTGNVTIANGTGLTLDANGSTLTLAAALPPSNLADLADVSGTPITNQALIYNGTQWQPGDVPAGTTLNTLSGAVTLATGTGLTLDTDGSTLTLSAALPPSNLADLADVSGSPSADQTLIYNGTEWQPGDIPAGTTVNTLAGAVTLVAGDNVAISESGQEITISATVSGLQGADGADGINGTDGADGADGAPANLTLGDITTLTAGSDATATLSGTAPDFTLNFGLPAGDTGPQGAAGPTTNLTIGSVTTGAEGSNASATISGSPPDLALNLTLPVGATGATGDPGATGPQGAAGPTTNLTIGTVTTGAAGSNATATIVGTPPDLTLNLTIPQGSTGAAGANGTSGMSLGLFFALS